MTVKDSLLFFPPLTVGLAVRVRETRDTLSQEDRGHDRLVARLVPDPVMVVHRQENLLGETEVLQKPAARLGMGTLEEVSLGAEEFVRPLAGKPLEPFHERTHVGEADENSSPHI